MAFGSCECGKIKYNIPEVPSEATACHCLECRKAFKGTYGPWTGVPKTSIVWSTEPDLWKKTDIAERGYCSACAVPITMQYFAQPDRISLSLPTLARSVPITKHIFLKEQENGYVLPEDGAARYREFDIPFEQLLQEWRKSSGSRAQK